MPQTEGFCAYRGRYEKDAEKQTRVRQTQKAPARQVWGGPPTQAVPSQLMDGAHSIGLKDNPLRNGWQVRRLLNELPAWAGQSLCPGFRMMAIAGGGGAAASAVLGVSVPAAG